MPDTGSRILSVDDNEAARYIRGRLLRSAGFAVRDAASGAQALADAAEVPPDLVLLDVNLPDMSGLEVCRKLRENPALASVPIIHLSASSILTQDRVAGLETGADAYLTEPVEPEVLLATVRATLRARRAERERAVFERRYRQLYDANIVGLATADRDRILEANDAFLVMIGRSREELAGGGIAWDSVTGPLSRGPSGPAPAALSTEEAAIPSEQEFLRPDGSTMPVLLGTTILERRPMQWLCFAIDLTVRKRLEQRLRNTHKLESIGILAGGVAHDFNNLLTGMMGNVGLAMELIESGHPAREMLEDALHSCQRAADLTRQLLAYAGKGRFVLERLDLSRVVRDTARLIEASVPKKIRLEFGLAPGLPLVDADAGQIQQVIMNLVTNGCEAIGGEAGTLLISTGVQHVSAGAAAESVDSDEITPGQYVFLEVRDSGSGMSEETRQRLFDPFFTTKFIGRGLGLAAVAGIVRAHKGAIRVESTIRKGSSFRVLLRARGLEQETAPAVGAKSAVLVVDDEPVVRDVTRVALEQQGYSVLVAGDGPSAISTFREAPGRIGLVVLDVAMPKMDGDEVLRHLRAIRPDVRVLVCSGLGLAETVERFEGQTVDAFLLKPFTPQQLAARVKELAEK